MRWATSTSPKRWAGSITSATAAHRFRSDEAKQQKEVLLVDLDTDGLSAITALPVRFQALISGQRQPRHAGCGHQRSGRRAARSSPHWLEVTVTKTT